MLDRQGHQRGLAARQHGRNLLHHLRQLVIQSRQQPEYHHHHEQHESGEHQPHRDRARHFQPRQFARQALEQIGDDDAGQHRRQHAAGVEDGQKCADQNQREEYDLRVGDLLFEPVGDSHCGCR